VVSRLRRGWAARPELRFALATAALATVAIVVLDSLVRDEAHVHGDDLVYERMAAHPGAVHTFPFAYRLLLPTLVHVLPFGHTFSFSLLAWICTGLSAGLVTVLLARLDVGRALRFALALGFALSPALLLVSLRQGRNTDAISVLFLLLGTLFIIDRRRVPLAATIAVGALTRESTLFLVPMAYAVWCRTLVDAKALRAVAATSAAGVAVYAAIRLAVPTIGREQVIGYGLPFFRGRWQVLRAGFQGWWVELRRIGSVFGPLWLCLVPGARESALVRRSLVVLACCAISATFALDWGRVALLGAPAVVLAAGVALRSRPRAAVAAVVALALLDIGYAIYMNDYGTVHGIDMVHGSPYPIR
jgi:hypothetical protein